MKAFLMFADRDFEPRKSPVPNAEELMQDLELDTLFLSMAAGDEFLHEAARSSVLESLHDLESIQYRQQILTDCMSQSNTVRQIYAVAVEAIEREKKVWGWMSGRYPEGTLHRSIDVLQIFVELLKRLRSIADLHGTNFHSAGFRRFFAMLQSELNDEYLRTIEEHLERLKFRDGILMSAQLGPGNKGANYVLCKPSYIARTWFERLQNWMSLKANSDHREYIYEVHERDEAGYRALSELRTHGIAHIASALAQSTDHILAFFRMLRLEMGFYIGCLNLRDQLLQQQASYCLPVPSPGGQKTLAARGLYDVCLQLGSNDRVVSNDVDAGNRSLLMITGANRGGKSTFLRSIGVAQLMMQCGMFVPAESFRAGICSGIFTHFKREEDVTMKSGKLDEELARMSAIIDRVAPHGMVVLNESFASTNEREGSEIARQILRALLEMDVRVAYVTHMFDLAQSFYQPDDENVLFLRAERLAGGQRTFRLIVGEPLPTSYGEDLYRQIFGASPAGTSSASQTPIG
ncbi:MAG TPA: hypothetical protein VMD58_10865 [Acidobacteriaceae bacterium]|nr:hypothetical protein [Acidobacteriaceae bacterium]